MGCIVLGLGLWLASQEIEIYDPHTHIKFLRTTVGAIELSRQWAVRGRLLPKLVAPPRQPLGTVPASIAALATLPNPWRANRAQAVAIFRAALLELLATGQIEVYDFRRYTLHKWHRIPRVVTDYLLTTTPTPLPPGWGWLECTLWAAADHHSAHAPPEAWRGGIRLYDLVCEVYQNRCWANPATWLAQQVADDAVARGFGHRCGALFGRKFEWARGFRQEQQMTQGLAQGLTLQLPEFSRALDMQIDKAIQACEDTGE